MTAGALHAVRQLAWHLAARRSLHPPRWLTQAEARLFMLMPAADQREGLAVARTLVSCGWRTDRELLAAGLLHDAGKSLAPARVRYRVLMTLIEKLAPALIAPLARRSAAIAALAGHATAGARLAEEAGLPPAIVELIRGHHQPPADARSAALQRADALH